MERNRPQRIFLSLSKTLETSHKTHNSIVFRMSNVKLCAFGNQLTDILNDKSCNWSAILIQFNGIRRHVRVGDKSILKQCGSDVQCTNIDSPHKKQSSRCHSPVLTLPHSPWSFLLIGGYRLRINN